MSSQERQNIVLLNIRSPGDVDDQVAKLLPVAKKTHHVNVSGE